MGLADRDYMRDGRVFGDAPCRSGDEAGVLGALEATAGVVMRLLAGVLVVAMLIAATIAAAWVWWRIHG